MKTFRIIFSAVLLLSALLVFVFHFLGGIIQIMNVPILNSIQYGVFWAIDTSGRWFFVWFLLIMMIPFILPPCVHKQQEYCC